MIGRVTTPEDLSAMAALADRVFFGGSPGFAQRYRCALSLTNQDNLFIAKDAGTVVSAVASYPAPLRLSDDLVVETLAIGGVCTDESHRGQGLSTRLLDEVHSTAVANGVDVLLISGEGALYERLGARKLGRLIEVQIPRASFGGTTVNHDRHTRLTDELVEWVLADHRATRPRFLRSADELAQLLAGHLHTFRDETAALLVPRDRPGYAVVRTGYEGDVKVGFVVEHGGDPGSMWEIAMAEAREQGCDKLYGRLLATDDLGSAWRGFATPIEITGTVALVDADRFLAKLTRHVRASSGVRAGHKIGPDGVSLFEDAKVVFRGPVYDVLPFLLGDAKGCKAPAAWQLPSFRIDNLNFL